MKRLILFLALVSGTLFSGADISASTLTPIEAPLLRLRASTFDPTASRVRFLSATAYTQYQIIQAVGPIQPGWRESLEGTGARIFDYVPEYAFICRVPSDAASLIWKLPFVRAVTPYLPAYRVSPKLAMTGPVSAVVSLFPDADPAAFAVHVKSYGLEGKKTGSTLVTVTGEADAVRRLAQEEGVRWIEPRPRIKVLNNRTRPILGVSKAWTDLGLYGSDQIVGIFDTGLDTGNPETMHADFLGRVVAGMGLNTQNDWADRFGHGTHVAGTIAGNGARSASRPKERIFERSFAGIAPEAKLVIQEVDVEEDGTSVGFTDQTDLGPILQWAYDHGARLHNNSWGDDNGEPNAYTLHAQQIDRFIWEHPDFAMFFAAGNEGIDGIKTDAEGLELLLSGEDPSEYQDGMIDPGSLSTPATAKNVVTVGASEGDRPSGPQTALIPYSFLFFRYQTDPIASDFISNNVDGMAAFSSRGPTLDGRTKPDIVAPGTNILSTISSVAAYSGYWEIYNASYGYAGGTSMSTPVTTGAAALVREWLQKKRNVPAPSAALIKALLLNGARDLSPGQYGENEMEIPPRPNSIQGWGRVDLDQTLLPLDPREIHFSDVTAGLATGEKKRFVFEVEGGTPLALTLAWSDYPGVPSAAKALVNDLDLVVTGPDGKVLRGNGAEDRLNNVEGIDIPSPATGNYTVEIAAVNVPKGPQPFALVVSGNAVPEGGVPPPPIRPGDVNLDTHVNTVDVVLALRSIVNLETLSATQIKAADVAPLNAPDGKVDINDAFQILRFVVGI
ncbi:MAG: S8 family serine peptidase [Armatimonadetes bacterium]|nr:S8 family serine peptidase [Armatimonadota bacterium]